MENTPPVSVAQLEESLHPQIGEILQKKYPGALVTHWTAAIAVVTPSGTEMVVILDRPGQAIWQSFGLEKFVSEMRKSAVYASEVDDFGDDED